jgi:hypothetical protein
MSKRLIKKSMRGQKSLRGKKTERCSKKTQNIVISNGLKLKNFAF